MSTTQSGSTKIRDLISTANEVCNMIRQRQGGSSRLGSNILHVTDGVNCVAKVYMDRGFDPAGVCYQLVKMFQGKLLETASIQRLCSVGYEHEPTYGGLLQPPTRVYTGRRGRPREIHLPLDVSFSVADVSVPSIGIRATPDFVAPPSIVGGAHQLPETLLEMAVIGYAVPMAHFMAMRQARFLNDLNPDEYGIPLPPVMDPKGADNYPDEPGNFPQYLFLNHLLQIAAYRAALAQENPTLATKFLAIYTNAEREYSFAPEHLAPYYDLFEERIGPAAYAITQGAQQVAIQSSVGVIERGVARQKYDPQVFQNLYFYELHSPGILLASIRCPTCSYYSMGICPGVPPMRTPYDDFQDKDRLIHFLNITKFGVSSPLLTQVPIEAIMDPHKSKGADRRKNYLDWLREVLKAVPQPPDFPHVGVSWTGLVEAGTCDIQALAKQMAAFTPAGQSERAAPPNP